MDTAQRHTMAAAVLTTSNCTALAVLRRSADHKLLRTSEAKRRMKLTRERFAALPGWTVAQCVMSHLLLHVFAPGGYYGVRRL